MNKTPNNEEINHTANDCKLDEKNTHKPKYELMVKFSIPVYEDGDFSELKTKKSTQSIIYL